MHLYLGNMRKQFKILAIEVAPPSTCRPRRCEELICEGPAALGDLEVGLGEGGHLEGSQPGSLM